ncbi:MAG: NAD(P)/FAD-dependent oxidoreductase [Telmatospirillum sp.]|nr:NAD(P)/FAD-dependent oxidoreductase [Telmatospirillum sp.]
MDRKRLVVVGNGMAGVRTLEELLALAPDRYDIRVFGAEPRVNYNRIMLSPVLAGEKSFADIVLNDADWYEANGIDLRSGVRIVRLDRDARQVITADGGRVDYDVLLLATGSRPVMLPVPGAGLPGVVSFRDADDVAAMILAATPGSRGVVIGGGLLGLEAANGLKARGMAVTVVHLMDTLMERQLDGVAGTLLKEALEARGIGFHMQAATEAILGQDRVEAVLLRDGTRIPADLVVMAAGIRPDITLAADAALPCGRGVRVDDWMRTGDPSIFAVGECVEHRGLCHGLVAPLFDMAKVCAATLAGRDVPGYAGTAQATRLKVTGIDLFSAGEFAGGEGTDDIVYRDVGAGIYKRLVVRDGTLAGAVLFGETGDGAWYFDRIRSGADITSLRDRLIFGATAAAAPPGGGAAIAGMPDDAQICGCNGVSKGAIVAAIREKRLTSVDEVRLHTKASASCGQCAGLVRDLLAATVGTDAVVEASTALCSCTAHSHDHVREAIVRQGLKSIPEVMRALDWSTGEGCAKCRPALNYYLLCAWPGDYADHQPSRFVNERLHANIQRDGTYSVVPRLWGGLTNARELRAIANVVDRFHIPAVKVTGGQRIDLLGVHKEDLPAVWSDLNAAGLVSGHAYAKGLRTVKTCVGKEWCRFGTQDSTRLGVALERMTWGCSTPHKVKMAVSGCPRNCAEAAIKDFAVVCVDAGYDLVVGGNGGTELRAADPLCRVTTEAEVLEYCGAFLQIYREEARYLERTAAWVARVGIETVRQRVVADGEGRRAAHSRFLHSQTFCQDDPWADRVSRGVDAPEFSILREVVR